MRKAVSIARATAFEIASEPLSLLVTLSSLALAVLAPVLHYHQFGEATRMARDAGFSALFIGGSLIAVFGTIKTIRREIETCTADMAIAHSVSRCEFFLSKVAGVMLALIGFALTVLGVEELIVFGAALGEAVAMKTGEIAKVFGPCVAGGVAIVVLPIVLAALLNRFARMRFTIVYHLIVLSMALIPFIVVPILYGRIVDYLPVALLVLMLPMMLMTAAAAFAMRFRSNGAATVVGVVALLLMPVVGNYYLADALSRGATVGWSYVSAAALAATPIWALFLFIGARFSERLGLGESR